MIFYFPCRKSYISYPFTTQSRLLTTLRKKPFENIVGKRENACNQRVLFLPKCFSIFPERTSNFQLHLFCRLQTHSIFGRSKILLFGKRRNISNTTNLHILLFWHCKHIHHRKCAGGQALNPVHRHQALHHRRSLCDR